MVRSARESTPAARSAPSDRMTVQLDGEDAGSMVLDLTSQDWDLDLVGGLSCRISVKCDVVQENLEDEIVREALAKGVDLRVSARAIEEEMRTIEAKSVEDYVREASNMAKLYRSVISCDKVLLGMETTLSSFQSSLAAISGEIQSLQDQSQSMSVKLKNRKEVHTSLAEYVDGLVLSTELIEAIVNLPVSEAYIAPLQELDKKIVYIAQPHIASMISVNDVRPQVMMLLNRAAEKIREFILTRVLACRKPLANIQAQQESLLKLQYVYQFLYKHCRQEADQIRDEYADTIGKIHLTYYKTYLSRLLKFQFEDVADKDDLIGADDVVKTGFFKQKVQLKNRQTVFTLGNRGQLLADLEAAIIVPHTLEKAAKDFHLTYEQIFRNYAFLDNAAREYLFGIDFFGFAGEHAYTFFKAVMGKIMVFLLQEFDMFTTSSFDAIGLVLCARIIAHFKANLKKRDIPCLEQFYERMDSAIWPRFKQILELNTASVRAAEPGKLSQVDTRPHFIVRRFAEYSSSILSLDESNEFHVVIQGLSALRDEVFQERKTQLIFLINNYDMMLSVFQERGSAFAENDEFQKHLDSHIDQFATEQLQPTFGGIMRFVKETEAVIAKEKDPTKITVDTNLILTLNRNFARDWKKCIEDLDADVMRSFTNFKIGTIILQKLLTNLLEFYDRFLKILKASPFRRANGWPDLVDPHHLMMEVKKHKTTF